MLPTLENLGVGRWFNQGAAGSWGGSRGWHSYTPFWLSELSSTSSELSLGALPVLSSVGQCGQRLEAQEVSAAAPCSSLPFSLPLLSSLNSAAVERRGGAPGTEHHNHLSLPLPCPSELLESRDSRQSLHQPPNKLMELMAHVEPLTDTLLTCR